MNFLRNSSPKPRIWSSSSWYAPQSFSYWFTFNTMERRSTSWCRLQCFFLWIDTQLIWFCVFPLPQSLDPMKRLGCEEMGGYEPLKQHSFFDTISWSDLDTQTPPKLTPYLPAMSEDDEDCYGNVGATVIKAHTHAQRKTPEHTTNCSRLSLCLSTTTSSASSATCRWHRRARRTPCRRKSRRPRRGPAATSSSTSTTSTITLLSWTCSSRTKRSDCCWINRPQETPGKHCTVIVVLERAAGLVRTNRWPSSV